MKRFGQEWNNLMKDKVKTHVNNEIWRLIPKSWGSNKFNTNLVSQLML